MQPVFLSIDSTGSSGSVIVGVLLIVSFDVSCAAFHRGRGLRLCRPQRAVIQIGSTLMT